MNIDFLKNTSRLLTEDIQIDNTDEIVNKIIEQKFYKSLAYQVCEVSPAHSIESGVFAIKYVDDPAFPGKKKVVLLRNNVIINEDPIEDTGFTVETLQDLQRQYGKSATDYIAKTFAGISAHNENLALINYLSVNAVSSANAPVDPNNAETATFNIQQKVSELLLQINGTSFKSLDAFVILPSKWAASILGVKNLLPEKSTERELYLGRNSRTKFYLNPDPTSVECFVGVHSSVPGLSSLIMSPYHHALKIATNPETGEQHVFNFNRYAITENALSTSDVSEKMIYKFEIDAVPGAGSGGPLSVLDEGNLVNSSVCAINFIGADVMSNQDPNNSCQVNVYIPTPAYPSHYNTVDGNTNGVVANTPTSQRVIAKPSGPRGSNPGEYNENGWSQRLTERPCTRNDNVSYNNVADILLDDESTVLKVEVFDADGTTVLATNTIDPVNSNTTSTVDNITINISDYGASSDKFKAKIQVSIDLSSIIPNSGRVTVKITHTSGGTDYVKSQEFFYDSESNTAAINGNVNIQENSSNRIIKYLSGVKYYDLSSPFIIDIDDIDNLNGDSYPQNQMLLTAHNMGLPDINIHDTSSGHDLTDWTNDWNDVDDSYHNENWDITAHDYCFVGDGVANANTIDWTSGPVVSSPAYPMLINTWGSHSDELSEYFLDEDFRLMSDFSTAWDSTQSLVTYDGNDTGVQTMCGRIKVPGTSSATNANNPDFSSRNPLSNPDYTGLTGNNYYRKFTDTTSSVRSSCTLHIDGFTLQDLKDNKVEIWINIPGRFNTFCPVHSTSEYNFSTFDADLNTGSNGPYPTGSSTAHYDDALRVNSSTDYEINITFGSYGLDSTHNFFEMRLIINDDTIEPQQITVSW